MNEFFNKESGESEGVCLVQLPQPTAEETDRAIAEGSFYIPQNNLARSSQIKAYLYQKLSSDPIYASSTGAFTAFKQVQQNTSTGKFYEVASQLKESYTNSQSAINQSIAIDQTLAQLVDTLAVIDSLLEHDDLGTDINLKRQLVREVINTLSNYAEIEEDYRAIELEKLYEVLAFNEEVSSENAYAVNLKAVNRLDLLSRINQSIELTETELNLLKNIAEECPKTAGHTAEKARKLLPKCETAGMVFCEPALVNNVEPIFVYDDNYQGLMHNSTTTQNKYIPQNPTNTVFSINLSTDKYRQIDIFDTNGNLVFSQQSHAGTITEPLAAGMYIVVTEKLVVF